MNSTRLNGLNVLFVDDRRDARFVVQHILRDAGAVVTAGENGQQAVELVRKFYASPMQFDVLVLDVQMPIMNGLEAAAELRRQGIDTPILALSAGGEEGHRNESFEAGFNAYLKKPLDGEKLVDLVYQLARASSETVSDSTPER
ncbi:response regulator [Planctomicrobium sp. SH668]|uniref:response regulator n=1 Tax=Planctomicrobium sp. SH668 TaxID=3448126 RepID=UPI003F5C8E4B